MVSLSGRDSELIHDFHLTAAVIFPRSGRVTVRRDDGPLRSSPGRDNGLRVTV